MGLQIGYGDEEVHGAVASLVWTCCPDEHSVYSEHDCTDLRAAGAAAALAALPVDVAELRTRRVVRMDPSESDERLEMYLAQARAFAEGWVASGEDVWVSY